MSAPRSGQCLAVVLGVAMATAHACDLPVYRYALERWSPDSHAVLFFFDGEKGAADAEVRRVLGAGECPKPPANVTFREFNRGNDERPLPEETEAEAWERHQADRLPFYIVLTPDGREVFAGKLAVAEARGMLSSPVRERLAGELCAGKMVLLFLRSGRKEADDEASAAMREAMASAGAAGLPLTVLEVGRKDPSEDWLVRQLLTIEEDLPELDSPMVFGVIGRGHVLPPYVGKGISPENIRGLLEMMGGPCTCELKGADGGLDLLMDWDWEGRLSGRLEEAAPVAAPSALKGTDGARLQRRVAQDIAVGVGVLLVVVVGVGVMIWRRRPG